MDTARDLIEALVPLAGLVVLIGCIRAWLARTADLKLSLFGPYPGDGWPVGVQEDDDFRFNWSAATTSASALSAESPVGKVVGPFDNESRAGVTLPGSLEELRDGSVALERLDRISVHRFGH